MNHSATLVVVPLAVLLLGCVQPPPPPVAAPASDAAALFARFKAATGGPAWDSVVAMRSEGKLTTGGLSGKVSEIEDTRTGKRLSRVDLGAIQAAEGFDGAHPWEQDPGGEVTAHDAPESLEVARTDTWLTTRGFLQPGFAQAEVSPPREQVEGGARYLVVDATPSGGRKVALWFDAQTSLLARTAMRRDRKIVTSVLDDYRAVPVPAGSVRIAFHSAQDSADASGHTDPREHEEVALERVTVNPALDAATFAMPAMASSAHIEDASGVTRVPFQLINNHIYAEGTIDGKPVHFIVDTGGANLLTPAAAARLGLEGKGKMAASGVGDAQVDLAFARAHEVRVGAAVLANPVFFVIDLGSLSAMEGVEADGLVGFEMFRRFCVTVDYQARVLTLAEPARFTPPPGAHVVPFDLAVHIPVITGKLDGLPVRISVDTGSRSSLSLNSPFVRAHDLVKRYDAAPERVTGWGVGGPALAHPARLGTLELGDLAIKDIAGDLSTSDKGAFANPDLSANLGGGVLKRFRVSFDYEARKMYLAPNAGESGPDPFDRSGLWLTSEGDGLKVVRIAPHGAAEKAGLRDGDRILTVGGEPTKARSIAEWRARFSEQAAGTRLALRVTDGTRERPVELVLADAIPAHAVLTPAR